MGLAEQSVRLYGGRLQGPEVWILGHETRVVHLQCGNEPAARTLVPIACGLNAAVELVERLDGETGEAKPGCLHLCLLSDGQTQAANRQQVGRWAEAKVKVDTARHGGTLRSVEPPAASSINRERDLNCLVSDPACNPSGQGLPLRVADHQVIQPAWLLMVC